MLTDAPDNDDSGPPDGIFTMLDAKSDLAAATAGCAGALGCAESAGSGVKRPPVLVILHQPHSTPGHVGHCLRDKRYPLDIRRPRFGDPLPTSLNGHAGAIIFGGPMSARDEDDYIHRELALVERALAEQAPLLGICLGGQMLARVLGARIFHDPGSTVEIGYTDVSPTPAAAAWGPWPNRVYQWHREGFDLPVGAEALVRSASAYPEQAFRYGPAAIATQFHPEITWAMMNRWSGSNEIRLHLRGAQPRADQMSEHLVNGPKVLSWLDGFLDRWLRSSNRPLSVDA
jgi:GMP synthase (glutamine-hydrolysing)